MSFLCPSSALVGVGLEFLQRDEFQCADVAGFEYNGWGHLSQQGFLPALDAEAPAIPRLKSGETEARLRGGEIIAHLAAEHEKGLSHDSADGVHAAVVRAGLAIAVAVEAGYGVHATGLELAAEDVG